MKLKFLKLIFYHHFSWQEKVGNGDIAPFSTVFFMGLVMAVDIVMFDSIVHFFFQNLAFYPIHYIGLVLICALIMYLLLAYRYDYRRMVQLSKVKVGKRGKWIWVVCMLVSPIVLPFLVCLLWWAKNNGYILTNI